jgi:hypothetical protein
MCPASFAGIRSDTHKRSILAYDRVSRHVRAHKIRSAIHAAFSNNGRNTICASVRSNTYGARCGTRWLESKEFGGEVFASFRHRRSRRLYSIYLGSDDVRLENSRCTQSGFPVLEFAFAHINGVCYDGMFVRISVAWMAIVARSRLDVAKGLF